MCNRRFPLFFTWASDQVVSACISTSFLTLYRQNLQDSISPGAEKSFGNCSALYFGVSDEFGGIFGYFADFSDGCFDMHALYGRDAGVFVK